MTAHPTLTTKDGMPRRLKGSELGMQMWEYTLLPFVSITSTNQRYRLQRRRKCLVELFLFYISGIEFFHTLFNGSFYRLSGSRRCNPNKRKCPTRADADSEYTLPHATGLPIFTSRDEEATLNTRRRSAFPSQGGTRHQDRCKQTPCDSAMQDLRPSERRSRNACGK